MENSCWGAQSDVGEADEVDSEVTAAPQIARRRVCESVCSFLLWSQKCQGMTNTQVCVIIARIRVCVCVCVLGWLNRGLLAQTTTPHYHWVSPQPRRSRRWHWAGETAILVCVFFFFSCDTHFLTSEIQICSGSGGRAASEPGSLPNSVSRSKSFCRSLWWTADGSWFKKRRKDTLVVTRLRRLNYEQQFLRSRSSAETFWNIVPWKDLWSRESFSQSFRGDQKLVVDFFFTVKSWAWENVIGN